jgi:putative endonuclease
MMQYVYILYSRKLDRFYVGRTEDLDFRLQLHNNPIESRKYTARGIPWELRLKIPCESKEQTIQAEKLIKQMKSRKFIESLLEDELLVAEILKRTRTHP